MIKHPYPKTTYCDVPPEPRTSEPLCRPLPKDLFPPPPPKPRPIGIVLSPPLLISFDSCAVVGSAEYVKSRSSEVSFDAPSSRRRKNYGSEIAPSDSISQVIPQTAVSGIGPRALPPHQRDQPLLSQWLIEQRSQPVCTYLL